MIKANDFWFIAKRYAIGNKLHFFIIGLDIQHFPSSVHIWMGDTSIYIYCFMDLNNTTLIPQNEKNFFLIEKSINYSNAIEIKFNLQNSINFSNLYLIIKSYVKEDLFITNSIGCVFKEKNGKRFLTDNLTLKYFNKMNQFDFEEWLIFRINKDWKYNIDEDFYCLIVFFEKKLIELENIKTGFDSLRYLKPIYPWNNFILVYLKKNSQDVINFKNKEIEAKDKEIQKMSNKIIKLENKIKSLEEKK